MGFRLDIKPSKSWSWCRLHKRTHSLKYLKKSILKIHAANGAILKVNYKLPRFMFAFQDLTSCWLVCILESPFFSTLRPFAVTEAMFTIINDKGVIRFCTKPVHQPKKLYHTKKKFINKLTAKIGNTRI